MEHNCINISVVLIVFLTAITMSSVNGRELRPSDHGLSYQDSSSTPDMQTFFNGQTHKPLPAARNVSEWWRPEGGRDKASSPSSNDGRSSNKSRNGIGDDVKVILLLASLVCGVIGVALLLTSVLVYLFRYRKNSKQKQNLPLQEEEEVKDG